MPGRESFKIGDKVLAKWPGSSLYYDAEVISLDSKDAEVRFMEGSEETLPYKFISIKKVTKSDSDRSQSPGRSRAARSKSPGRRRPVGRPSSPSRRKSSRTKSKSPTRETRRSSSRTRGSKVREQSRSMSPVSKNAKVTSVRKRKESPPKISETPTSENSKPASKMTPTRSSSRIAAIANKAAQEIKEDAIMKTKKILDFPDFNKEKKEATTAKYGFFSHLLTHVMIILMPCLCYLIFLSCTKRHCSLSSLPPKLPTQLQIYFSWNTFGIYVAWMTGIFVFSLLPIGKIYSSNQRGRTLLYRFNGFAVLLLAILCVGILQWFGFSASYVYKKIFKLMTSSIVFSFIFSIMIYIKSFWASKSALSPNGNTGCWPTDFFVGRETDPRFGRTFDIKLFLFRSGLLGWVMVLVSFLTQEYSTHGGWNMNPSLVLSSTFQILYAIAMLYNEDSLLTASGIKEPVGFCNSLIILTVLPFLYTTSTLFMLNYRPVLPVWILACIVCVFVGGFFILMQSNLQKHRFRMNPYDPRIAHLETIPTTQGKKLLASGWWGWVCHPNYIGDIVTTLSFTLPAGFNYGLPHLLPLYMTLMLIVQARNDDKVCEEKYGPAWKKYRERVKYRLIPYIY